MSASNLIDLYTAVKVHGASERNEVADLRAELRERAQYLEESHGVQVMNPYEFDRFNPSKAEERSFLTKFAINTGIAALAVGGAVALLAGPELLISSPWVMGGVAAGASALGLTVAVAQNDRPEIEEKQLEKYIKYLDEAEEQLVQSHPLGVARATEQTIAVPENELAATPSRTDHVERFAPSRQREVVQTSYRDMVRDAPVASASAELG